MPLKARAGPYFRRYSKEVQSLTRRSGKMPRIPGGACEGQILANGTLEKGFPDATSSRLT